MLKQKQGFFVMYSRSKTLGEKSGSNFNETIGPRSYPVYNVQQPFSGSCTFYTEVKYGTTYRGYLFYVGEFSGKHYYQGTLYKAGVRYPTPKGEQILV